jgi:hypothetical protein
MKTIENNETDDTNVTTPHQQLRQLQKNSYFCQYETILEKFTSKVPNLENKEHL